MRRPAPVIRRMAAVLLLLTPLLIGEIGVRVLIAAHRLPSAPAHRFDFEVSWTNLSRAGTVDILILGDSVAQQGIDPAVLEQLIRAEVERTVTTFNAASPGGNLGTNAAIVAELARERRLPPIVIVGVYSGTLSTDEVYRDVFSRTPMGRLFDGCAGPMELEEALDCRASQASTLWRWRGRPDRLAEAISSSVPHTDDTDSLLLRADGFREGRGRPVRQLERQLTRADLDRRRFALTSQVEESWERLTSVARNAGATVIPVAIPDTPPMQQRMERLQPGRSKLYHAAVRALGASAELEFVEVDAFGRWWGDGMARNYNHLSRRGATEFTRQLWNLERFRERILGALPDDDARR